MFILAFWVDALYIHLLQGVICTVEYNLGLSHDDFNGEVFLLVR